MTETFAASGSTTLKLGPRDEKWDGGEAVKSLEPDDYPKAFFWRDPNGDPSTKAAYKLPFAERTSDGLHAVWAGVTAAAAAVNGARGGVNIPDADIAGVQKKIEAYYQKARKQYGDDTIQVPWEKHQAAAGEFFAAVVPLTHVDVRDPSSNPDNTWTFSGYAAVFNQQAIFLDSKWLQVRYEIDPGFFDDVMRTQQFSRPDGVVHYNLGHDMNFAVAATDVPAGQPGSLQLSVDAHGLRYLAKVSKDDPDGVKLAVKMRDGVIRQASMAFMCAADQTTETENEDGPDLVVRRLLSCKQLFDVCACPQGVFPQTVSGLQQFAAPLIGQPGAVALGGHPRQPLEGGASSVNPAGSGGVASPSKPRLAADTIARINAHRR